MYYIIQVAHKHFKAEHQVVGFPEVPQMFQLNGNFCHLSTFRSDSLFFLFSSHALRTHSCVYAFRGMCGQAHGYTNAFTCSWHTLVMLNQDRALWLLCPGMAIFPLSVLSRCLTFDILKSQDIIASGADKRAVFAVHLTSLFKQQINFLWCRHLSQ